MNQKELKKAMDNQTPVYYIDDENYDYHCKNTVYEVAEADVYEVCVPQQDIVGTDTYLQFEGSDVKYLIDNKNIFLNSKNADREAARRFKVYVKNLRKRVKEAEEALAECEKRLKKIEPVDIYKDIISKYKLAK